MPKKYFVYMVRCSDESLYTGITNNLENRLKVHNSGKASKYTRGRLPVKLVYQEDAVDRSFALKREITIKKLSKFEKEKLLQKNAKFDAFAL